MANTVEILIAIKQKGEQALAKLETGLKKIQATSRAYHETLRATNSEASRLSDTLTRLAAAIGGVEVYRRAITSAFQFNDTLEQSRIGIAALIRTFNDFSDSQGRAVSAQAAYGKSMEMAEKIQRRLQIAGLDTTATYQQLLRVMQEGLGPAFKQGFNPDQVVEFVTLMAQAGAALSVPMEQLGQEVRAILEGTIDENARIAKSLGLTKSKIEELAKSGDLFTGLKKRLQEFEIAGRDAAKTWSGATSNLADAIQVALGRGLENTFKQTTGLILRLQEVIVTIDRKAGTITFNERIVAALKRLDSAIMEVIGEGQDLDEWVGRAAEVFVNIAIAALKFADAVVKIVDALGPMLPVLADIIAKVLLFKIAWGATVGVLVMVATHIAALTTAAKVFMATGLAKSMTGVAAAATGMGGAVTAASLALRLGLVGAAAAALYGLYQLTKGWANWRREVEKEIEYRKSFTFTGKLPDPSIIKVMKEMDDLVKISEQTGLPVTNQEEFNRLVAEGIIEYDNLAKKWKQVAKDISNTNKDVVVKVKATVDDEALKEATADQKRLQEQLADDLIRIDGNRWEIERKEAIKYYEDQVKLAHGNADLIHKAKLVLTSKLKKIDEDQAAEQIQISGKVRDLLIKDQQAIAESQVRRLKASTETALQSLEDIYQRGEISVAQYYDRRRAMLEAVYQKEIDLLRKKAADLTSITVETKVESSGIPVVIQPSNSLQDMIAKVAQITQMDQALLTALVQRESSGNARARSSAGAMGLTQLMPGTAREMGVIDAYDPWQNLVGGAKYLSGLLRKFNGDIERALAAYNAGPNSKVVRDWKGLGSLPASMQDYIKDILRDMTGYAEKQAGALATTDQARANLEGMLNDTSAITDQIEIQDEIYERQEQHKRDIATLNENEIEDQKRITQNAKEVEKILADMASRSLQSSPNLADQFKAESDLLDRQYADEIQRLTELNATKEDLDDAYRSHKLEKDKLLLDQERRLWESRLTMASDVAGSLSSIFSDLYDLTGKKNKEYFALAKAAAMAEAIVNGALAITKAMAQGGIWGIAQSAIIAASVGVQIAKIQAQTLAKGGPVLGWSPHKKADNIPVMATAGEWVQPVDAVRYYGRGVMEALRRRLIPRELFDGFSIPMPAVGPAFAFAGGGQVTNQGASFSVSVPVNVSGTMDAEKISRILPGEIEQTVIRVMRNQLR